MGTTRKFLRNMDKVTMSNLGKATRLQKVVSAVTAMGFVLQPVAAMAQIVRADTKNTEVKFENGVAKVWAEKVINENVAMNVFKDFKVDANNIANMYFKTSSDATTEANNLVNFVNSRIDINGTVNAIKGGNVGGNLFFLSSDGMAVGASGVINAGALYVATPTQSAYQMYQSDGMLQKLVNVKEQDGFASIPINASGTISVLGKVNAINEVQLRAAKIGVGKNVSGKTEYMEANATSQDAYIKTGMAFSQVVNTSNYNVSENVTATMDGSGDIVLAASADTTNTDTGFASALGNDVHGKDTVQASVDIANGAQLIAKKGQDKDGKDVKGNIEITAEASNDKTLLGKIKSTNAADLLGAKVSKVEAKINIDGQLEANTITIAANAENSYEKDGWTEVGTIAGALAGSAMGLLPIDEIGDTLDKVDVAYAKLASNADVAIGSNAELTATGTDTLNKEANDDGLREGGALNISATSKLKAEIGAEVEAPDAPETGEEGNKGKAATTTPTSNKKKNNNSLSSIMPSAGIAVADTENNASVTIEGKLNSNGDANISAHALNEVEVEAGVSTIDNESGEAGSLVNAAVTVAKITNRSNVVLNGTTKVTGELNAIVAAQNEVTTAATAETDKDALASTAINVTKANSHADLTIGADIDAGSMNLAAENTVSNEIQAATQVGKSKFQTKSEMSGGALNAILGKVNAKTNKNNNKIEGGIGKYVTAGAAVNIVDETNSAKVTVKKGAKLISNGDINIAANNTIEDSFMSATSVVNNFGGNKGNTTTNGNVTTGGTTEPALLASVGLLQADMDNNAQIVIEGSNEQGTSAPVIKGANAEISANSSFEYDRLKSMWENLKEDWQDKTTDSSIAELIRKIDNKINAHKDGDVEDALDIADFISTAQELKEIPETLADFKDALLGFADVSNYTNFYTSASTAGGNAIGGTNNNEAKLGVTGSINLNSIKNNAQVIIGKNAKLDASVTDSSNNVTKGELNISATAKQHDVALNGKTKYFIPKVSNTSGGATAIGGSVGVHDADVNSLVVIGEGASLSGNDVSLSAENDLQHTAITFGGGAATNDGITGMFAYMEGQSNSIISVDDEASINAANKLALNANNDTTISNIIFDRTSAGNTAVGAAIGIIDYGVNNIAGIADNDSDGGEYDTKGNYTTRDEVKDLRKLVNDQLSAEEKVQLGTSTNKKGKGKIEANAVEVNAKTTGTITGVSIAGTTAGATQQRGQSSTGGFKLPAQIAGAGSGSANYISGNTAALLEGVDVTTTGTNGDVKVSASDESMIGAYSGAAALKKKGRQASSGGFSATLAGAVAYNNINTGVTAQIKDASIKNAAKITNIAAREGAVVAAGLALGVDTSGQGAGSATFINAGVSASINEVNNSTHAVMNNVTTSTSGGDGSVPKTTDIDNIAQSKDIQVAGGITAQYAKGGGIGIGAAVSSLHATNDIQSKITGSTLKNVGTLKAYAASDLVQVGTAISAGVIQGQNGNGVQAAVADNQLTNNVGVTISGGEIVANNVEAKAFDGKIESTIAGNATTTNNANKHLNTLAQEGFDVTGADAMADVNASQANVSVNKDQVGAEKKDANGEEQGDDGKTVSDFTADENSGNLIVSGAASIIANTSTQGKVTAGAAAVNQTINNNFTVDITNAKITAETVQAKAESDTLMVGVAAGVAVSTGQQGAANLAGSVGVMQLNNNTKTTIENSEITAQTIVAKAVTKSRLINVAGQVSASKGKVAAGLATATNILNNTTGAYVYGSTIKGKDGNEDTSLTVEADNNSEAYAVAVGVAAQVGQQGAALSGDVAVNKGKNNTEAIVGKRNGTGNTITNVDDININVLGNTTLNAISGGVTASTGNAGLGGAVAYNEVGNGDNDKQNTLAKLTDTVITTDKATTDKATTINVNAEDTSHVLAFAVGAAVQTGQTGAAAQGSAATTILHKNVEAAVSNVDIDKHEENKTDRHNAALNVTAQNTSEAITSADVMAISTANFAGGAAVAVTNSDNDTKASITGGNMNLKSGKVQADSNVDIINIGISAAVATGQGGSIAGNVAVNNIKNDTIASIDNATMNATGTIGVLANSKEHIKNYAGALAATVGQGYAAGGLSTAVNVISGNTKATVAGSTITAGGDDAGISVKEYYKDDNDKKYKDKDEILTGFVVNADSAHEIDNVVVTGGVAATAEFAVAGTGTVTVNTIKGETEASVTGTDVNATGAVGDKANVSVRANDNTEIDSHVGSASIAASANGGVGVGIASDSNVMSRKVTAKVVGDNAKKTVNANKLTVNAFNKHDITSSTTGVAVGAGAYAGVGVAGTISVVKTDAETTAKVENIEGKNNGFAVNADHVNKLVAISNSAALGGAVGGASIGAGVSIVQDGSKTEAALKGSNIDHYQDNAQDSVTAHNDTDLTSSAASIGASISIGAGVSDVITINNIDNTVQTTVEESKIGENRKADNVNIDATNELKTEFTTVGVGAGLVGVGMSIGVNTIDTSVVTNVTGGSMKANTVEITANENRDIDQTAVSAGIGGVAGSATVMVTNIGSQVSDKYGLTSAETVDQNGNTTNTKTEAQEVNISGAFKTANESAKNQDSLFGNGIDADIVLGTSGTDGLNMSTGLSATEYKTGVQANKGGDTVVDKNGNKLDVQGVKVNVNNAGITASDSATIKANAKTNAIITVGNAAAGAVSVGSTVGVLDVKRNSGVNITGGNISANNLTVGSDQSGTAQVDVYQAAASGANFGLFYSGVKLHGNNDINIKGAQLSGKNGVAITTKDTTTASLKTIGGSFALTENANIFVVDGKNESSSTITVDKDEKNKNSEIKAENGDVTITAKHGDGTTKTMTANIIPVSVAGVASGLGFNAMVEDNSTTAVDIRDNQQFTAKNNVNINAENNSVNEVTSVAANAALGVAVGATGVQAKGKATSKLTIGSNNTFTGRTVNLAAKANVNNKASITSIGAGFGNFMVNWATANGGTDVDVNIGDNKYDTENVNIKGESVIDQIANATGAVGGMYTSGTNLALIDSQENIDVVVGGNNANGASASKNKVNIIADGKIKHNVSSNGYGGAYFDISPVAAMTKSNITSNTNVKVTGNWNADTMDVSAVHDNNVTLDTDALKAAVVGLSGVESINSTTNNTKVDLENAKITTDKDIKLISKNDITYKNTITAGGYGAISGNALVANDTFAFNADVNLKNSTVTSNNGKVEMYAVTGDGTDANGKPNANIDKKVTLKSAGLVAGSLAFSKDIYNVNNNITVDESSAIATKGNSNNTSQNDINLISADIVGFTDVATADTQGGAVGAASTKLEAGFTRNNTITVNGKLDSNYDVELNAGGNSIMNLTLKSNAYNKTAAPIVANPGLDYTMTQNNKVIIGARTDNDNNIQTTRNINLIGDAGNTTIATQSESYKWTQGGTTSSSSLASTADGTQSKNDNLNNGVEVNGKLLAGKNDKLEITIENGKDSFGDKMNKFAEDNLKDKENAYTSASEAYNKYLTDNGYEQAQSDFNKAEAAKNTAGDMAALVNKRKEEVDNLKQTADNTSSSLTTKATEIFNNLKNASSGENQENNTSGGFTVSDVDAFLEQNDETIKSQMTAGNYSEAQYSEFIKLKNQAKTDQEAYASANTKLGNTVASANDLVEWSDSKSQYVVKSSVGSAYSNAENRLKTIKEGAASLKKVMDAAEKEYQEILDGTTIDSVNDYIHGDTKAEYVKVSADKWYTDQNNGNAYKSIGFKNYASGLTNRLTELENLIKEYAGSGAEAAFKEELGRVQSELIALGLGHFEKTANGTDSTVFIVDSGESIVPTLELDNIMVTGGNINIKGGSLSGSGTMKAVGNPSISITNKSDYYLRINDITIGSDGGNVKFNDVAVKDGQNGLNVVAAPGDLVNGNNATITIEANANKPAADSIYKPDIGIFGTIYNPYGDVTIKNTNNNIYIAGKLEKDAAGSIKARNIRLSAGGSITQGYTDGTVNISGDPKFGVSDEVIKKIQQRLIEKLNETGDTLTLAKFYTAFKTSDDLEKFLLEEVKLSAEDAKKAAKMLTNQVSKESDGMYAAGAIYINAAHINVNGTIQSGFDTYKVEVDQSKLDKLPKNYTGSEDKDFMTDTWLVTKAEKTGVVYENGKFVYNVKAWYNPKTGEIFTEDIDQSGGGRINIVGAVASTGNGKLVALDGGANVTINNDTGKNLKVASIDVDKVNGQITVTDTTKFNEDGSYQSKTYTRGEVIDSKATYDTTDGQMYIWTTGTSNQVITSYKAEYDSKWFGLDKDRWESQLDQLDKVVDGDPKYTKDQPTTAGDVINSDKLSGTYKSFNGTTDSKENNEYQIGFERSGKYKQGTNEAGQLLYWTTENGNDVLTTTKNDKPYYLKDDEGNYIYDVTKSEPVTTKKKKLWGLWGSHVTTTWTETTGVLTSYNFGLNASKDIGIEFIGNENGGSVGITSGGDVKLAGDIRANDVKIKSTNGSILADSFGDAMNQKTIFSDNLTLEAGNNIKIVQQGVSKELNLNAKTGTSKENYINIKALAGLNTGDIYLDNVSSAGDIILDIQGKALNGRRADLSDYATRNANKANANLSAGGKLILTATGGIGEENNAHIIKAGEFASMLAESGDIWAKQEGTDAMKLKQVEAKNGDVHLEAYGGFVDAIEENQTNTTSQADRIKEWKDQGVLSDKSLEQQKQDNYKEQVDDLEVQAKSNNILGNKFASEADRNAAANELIDAGKKLTEELASDYNNYYAARKDMYAKQSALNDTISKKNSGDNNSGYEEALTAYNTAFAKYAQAKKTYEDNKASKINAYVKGKYEDAQNGLKQKTNISQWLANYEELTHEAKAAGENRYDKYGWNQNQLLYAIQDSIINPSAGSVSDVNKANIIGNNIYLKTESGDLGKVMDDQAFNIKMSELENMFKDGTQNIDSTLLDKMNKLAGARADDVTWGTSQIEVKRLTPISVKLNKTGNANDGKVSIEAPKAKNIYVIAKDSKLTMDKVISEGNVRLTGQEGIDIGTVTGSNVSLEGGKGDIKHGDNDVLVGLVGNTGKLNANAAGDILIKQLQDTSNITLSEGKTWNSNMVLGSLAGKNIRVEANGNIVSGMDNILDANGKATESNGISYINASEKLTLVTAGSVGENGNGLRIKNSGGVVDIDAKNGAYLEAKGDGTLVLGTLKAGTDASDDFVVNSEGSLSVGREAVQEVKDENGNIVVAGVAAVEGSINGGEGNAKANVKLTTAKDITFSGKVRANELTAQSYAGDIEQTTNSEDKNIEANKLNVSAIAGNIKLANEHNVIKDINIEGLGGALDLVVSMDDLNLNLGSNENALSNNYGGDFKIKNNKGNINVVSANTNIYGNIELEAEKNITVKRSDNDTNSKLELNTNKLDEVLSNGAMLQPKGNITLTAGNSIENNGTITASAADVEGAEAKIIMKAKSVTNKNALSAKTDIDIDATEGNVENSGTLEAGNNIDIDASAGNITNNGSASAGQNVDLKASGNVENNAKVEAGKDVSLVAGGDIENKAEVNAKNDITFSTKGKVTTAENGTIISGNDVKLNAGSNITTNTTVTATNGNIEATTTNGDVTINNTVESGKDTNINAGTNSSVNINNTIKSGANTNLTANGTGVINITKNITAGGSISGTTTNGSITVGEDAPLMANNGSIKLTTNNASDVTAGTITVNGKLTTNNTDGVVGNIELTTDHGDITVNAESEIKNAGSLITKVGVGNVKFTDKANTNINNGSLENNVTKGSVENNANVTIENGNAKNTVENGNITINGATNITTGDVINKVTEGDVSFNGVTSVGSGNISTNVDNGNIDYNAETNVNTGNIYTEAKNGNIGHNANMTVGAGNITDKASGAINAKDKGKGDVALKAINGSIDIDAGGDINLAEVIAANGTADFNSANGSIYLRKVNGKNVILIAKKNILTDETYADNITTNGDNITLSISQDTGLLIDELLANTITINKAKGSLDIEKMAVTNRADFNVNGMKTTVWGKEAPERVDSDSIYWFNVNDWHRGGYWMNLIFSEKQNVQRSNGLLLQLRDYHYVYNQRFTAVNHLHQLLAEKKADEYDINFNPEVVHYFRHDLYDLDESEQQLEEHADPAKIVVEA